LTSTSCTLASASANTGSTSCTLAATLSGTSASTTAATAPSSALTNGTLTLTHAGMNRYGGAADLHELSTLKFFHDISDTTSTLVLVNIDLGRREGLHGIGADISCNEGRDALLRYLLGCLYPRTAG
jgi:hypothetical protein